MNTYTIKAFVRDIETKVESIVTIEEDATCLTYAIKQARHTIHKNGYKIIANHIQEESIYNMRLNSDKSDQRW
jgi:hypothetical protein